MTNAVNENRKGNLHLIQSKVKPELCFNYRGMEDIPDLIGFVGVSPTINPDLSLQVKKQTIKPGSFILRNEYGNITKVLTSDELEKSFEIRSSKPYSSEYAAPGQKKSVKVVEVKKVTLPVKK